MTNKWKFTEILLKKLYNNHTIKSLAKLYNCAGGTIYYYLKMFNIQTRKRGYNSKDNNNNYIDGRWNKIHFCLFCKKNKISYQTWRKNGKCMNCFKKSIKGKNNPSWKGGLPKCLDCGKILSTYSCKYCNSCKGKYISKWRKRNFKGRNNPMFGKTTQSKRIRYKGIWMRSSWETLFAQFLTLSGYKWQYEPKRFYFEDYSYVPDFYIPEWNLYVEIKGWWKKDGKKRFKLFKRKYPNKNIKVLMKKELQELGITK